MKHFKEKAPYMGLHPDLLLLSDSALPTGSFSHSNGLETFIARGEEDLQGLLGTFVSESLAKVDGPAFVLAYRAFDAGDFDELLELDRSVHAMKLPREWREAGAQTGRRLLAVGDTLCEVNPELAPPPLWSEYREMVRNGETPGQYPVAAGVLYCLLGIRLPDAALAYAIAAVKNLVGALIRLVPLGQTEGLKLQYNMNGLVKQIVPAMLKVQSAEELGGFSPSLEMAGMAHEKLYTRLFIS
jgi:urease accessory protein